MRRALALVAAIAMHWAAAATAFASDAGAEIVTTAQKRPEAVRDVPIALSVRDQIELDDRGIETIDDLQFQVPALVAGGYLDLTLRGVGAAVGPGGDPPFAVYQNGVLASRIASLNALHDLERVEILRGPQGPLYGRGAGGGVMNLVTRQPTDSFEAGLNYELGARSDSRVRGVLNAPLVGGRGAARLAVLYASERSDFSLLSSPSRESIGEETVSVRGSLRYQLLEDVRADLGWTFLRQDGGAIHPTGVPDDAATAPPGEAPSRAPAQRAHFATLGLSWRLGDFTVESISGYQSADSSLDIGGLSAVDDIRSWSSEVALLFDDGGPFDVLMGFRYFDERNEATREDDARGPHAGTDSLSPRHAAELERRSLQVRADNRISEGFTDATYKLTPSWRIGAGFRLAYTDRKFVDRSVPSSGGAVASSLENLPGTTRRADWSAVTWRVGADIDVGEQSLVYGTISTAERPGGFDFLREDPFRAEDLLAFEIGAKSVLFGERLRVSAASFFYDYRDVQARVAMAENEAVVVNLAAAESFGAELDWTAEPFDALLLNGTAGWLETRIDDGIVLEPDGGTGAIAIDVEGNRLPHSPRCSVNLGAQYTFPASDIAPLPALRGNLTARFDYTFRDDIFFDARNRLRQEGWDSGDLRFIYAEDFATTGVRIEAFVRNLWDEEAIIGVVPRNDARDALLWHKESRTFGLRVSGRWR